MLYGTGGGRDGGLRGGKTVCVPKMGLPFLAPDSKFHCSPEGILFGFERAGGWVVWPGGGGGWHKASASGCLPLAAPIGLLPLLILTPCGPERVLVVSTEPPDDLSCLTTPGVGCPGDGLLPVPLTRCIQMHNPSPCGGLPTPALTCAPGRGVRQITPPPPPAPVEKHVPAWGADLGSWV